MPKITFVLWGEGDGRGRFMPWYCSRSLKSLCAFSIWLIKFQQSAHSAVSNLSICKTWQIFGVSNKEAHSLPSSPNWKFIPWLEQLAFMSLMCLKETVLPVPASLNTNGEGLRCDRLYPSCTSFLSSPFLHPLLLSQSYRDASWHWVLQGPVLETEFLQRSRLACWVFCLFLEPS